MRYLLDANCFIEAKNRYYSFDFCPGFWKWLDQQNQLGVVYSIDDIGIELARGHDDLATWTKTKKSGGGFFLPLDTASYKSAQTINT